VEELRVAIEKGLEKYLISSKDKYFDIGLHSYLLQSMCVNPYSSVVEGKASMLNHDLKVLYRLFLAILHCVKEEVTESSTRTLFINIYSIKNLLLYLRLNYVENRPTFVVKFEEQIKSSFKLLIKTMLKERFNEMNVIDKIRILLEGAQQDAFTTEDIRRREVFAFFEKFISVEIPPEKREYVDQDERRFLDSLGSAEFYAMVKVLSNKTVFEALAPSLGRKKELTTKNPEPSRELVKLYIDVLGILKQKHHPFSKYSIS
jgi:hypothetical protein